MTSFDRRSRSWKSQFVQAGIAAPAKTITHSKAGGPHGHKVDGSSKHLRKPEGPVLIFSRTKIGADKLAQAPGGRHPLLPFTPIAQWISAARPPRASRRSRALVATDIAARARHRRHPDGHHEVPDSPDTDVHRDEQDA
jgi:hypothetical protein